MARAIWTIRYALDGLDDAAYLAWFHGEHIPEKRARPGYTWAAHYADGSGRYLALFGADDARTFLDPSPGQLKLRQDEATRRMVPHRREVVASVLVEVLRDGNAKTVPGAVRMTFADPAGAASEDENAAVIVQRRLPTLARSPGFRWASFLVPVLGQGRHCVLEAWDRLDAIPGAAPDAPAAAFLGSRIDPPGLAYPAA